MEMCKIKPDILLSVCIFAYNHGQFIREAIESVLCQITNFDFEILIGEDGSTDGTQEIVAEYFKKYPEKINVFFQDQTKKIYINGNPTGRYNFISTLTACKGKYIALLDGDDYWTDPYKLQKQVDFLEANDDFAICFHNTNVYNEIEQKILYELPGIKDGKTYVFQEFLKSNPVATASVVFYNKYIETIPEWFNASPFVDLALYIYVLF